MVELYMVELPEINFNQLALNTVEGYLYHELYIDLWFVYTAIKIHS
jgi:hypothetical protein